MGNAILKDIHGSSFMPSKGLRMNKSMTDQKHEHLKKRIDLLKQDMGIGTKTAEGEVK